MLLEIDDKYLGWVDILEGNSKETPEQRKARLTEYVNEVLQQHKSSWDGLHEAVSELPPPTAD